MAYFEQGSPAMQQLAAIVDRLETMVDDAGLANLFYALEVVCSAKARTNPSSAWHWMNLANTMAQGASAANIVEMQRKQTCLCKISSKPTLIVLGISVQLLRLSDAAAYLLTIDRCDD